MKEMPVWRGLSAHQKDGEDLSLLKGYTAPLLKPFITLWIFSFNGLFFAPNYPTLSTEDHGQTDQSISNARVLLTYMCFVPTGSLSFSLSVSKQCVVMINADVVCRQWAICVCRGRWVSRLRFGYISFKTTVSKVEMLSSWAWWYN